MMFSTRTSGRASGRKSRISLKTRNEMKVRVQPSGLRETRFLMPCSLYMLATRRKRFSLN